METGARKGQARTKITVQYWEGFSLPNTQDYERRIEYHFSQYNKFKFVDQHYNMRYT